jgi:hypothetical protein
MLLLRLASRFPLPNPFPILHDSHHLTTKYSEGRISALHLPSVLSSSSYLHNRSSYFKTSNFVNTQRHILILPLLFLSQPLKSHRTKATFLFVRTNPKDFPQACSPRISKGSFQEEVVQPEHTQTVIPQEPSNCIRARATFLFCYSYKTIGPIHKSISSRYIQKTIPRGIPGHIPEGFSKL